MSWFYSMFQVKKVIVQKGFERQKRGYRDISDFDIGLNDPLFSKQWYLVSDYNFYCLYALKPDLPSCLWQINQHSSYSFIYIILSHWQSVSTVIPEPASSTRPLYSPMTLSSLGTMFALLKQNVTFIELVISKCFPVPVYYRWPLFCLVSLLWLWLILWCPNTSGVFSSCALVYIVLLIR